jgi:hypothetical protein
VLDRSRRGWTIACGAGFCALFLTFSIYDVLRPYFWPDRWPDITSLLSGEVDPEIAAEMYRANLVYHMVHVPVLGGVIGYLQVRALKSSLVRSGPWVALTALGFACVFVFEALRPTIITGGHPGPTEPILIGVGGGSLAGILQALYLRSQGVAVYRWLKLWFVGLLAGVAAAAAVLTLLGWILGPLIRSALTDQGVYLAGQFVFYLVYGSLLGTLAGLISGGAIVAAVPSGREPEIAAANS